MEDAVDIMERSAGLLPEEEEAEKQHIQKIIRALQLYRKYAYARVNQSENYLNSLPKTHQNMLSKYRKHLGAIRDCIDANQAVIKKMLRENILSANSKSSTDLITSHDTDSREVKMRHQEHAQSTLKLIARDWSQEGAEERNQSYKPIINAVEEFFKPGEFELNEIKILVPGAGLGRLTYELACRGYECEGNEFSYFMLIASNFVLNQCTEENAYTLYPWVHQYVNNLNKSDQVASIRFPDICPARNPPKGNIMMAAGDFLEVYKVANTYDCVATCFFIDCANNIVEFIETIFKILIPGGIWINLGPLLYHYSDIEGENSIEPTYEDLISIIDNIGFEIIRNDTGIRTKYAQNPKSMLKSEYESVFWICRKPYNTTNFENTSDENRENGLKNVMSEMQYKNHICNQNNSGLTEK
ncbi:carnosine N-methyltransferase-like isoform X2 [Teleopsis dalmanni]|uniref:carnosine N-methyltransferase-like isoform X2 n=1 Tax=Teleopsis dalmanni TaxID=139649 RepID=UPI0018CD6E76|nr:carnosine N-methyltransferase-like isoform X2 [Teleopsis dalmanni]XP_037934425.1 carnosine N-methyltransferase-like isoform X2 [Teleopsis dalmanni]